MAQLFPALNSVLNRMTSGERRFARRLESHLENDYLAWYESLLGRRRHHPDFVLLHPRRGILVLEVKDWKLETIRHMDPATATLLTDKGEKTRPNPLEQARQYAHQVVNVLEGDPVLQQDHPSYAGQLIAPWGYGVVLANISRKQFDTTDLGEVLPASAVICQDEMVESVDPEAFQKRLWDMFHVVFPCTLSLPQVDRIRWHLFPEIRLEDPVQGGLDLPAVPDSDEHAAPQSVPDLVRVMDLQQEQLARSMGGGHRVIHGVAGSGKTMILGYRCLYLAQHLRKPILVLCYNATLAAQLQAIIDRHGLGERVAVRNFHRWCLDQVKLYNVARPEADSDAEFYEALVERVIAGVDAGQIPRAQYGAVMIDEGHDFRADWLRLVSQMVDPETDNLLLLYDDAQSIYQGGGKRGFSFKSVGIKAAGRTTILRLNYRNTSEVLQAAYRFAEGIVNPQEAEEDGIPVVSPESAGRRGPPPELHRFKRFADELQFIAKQAMALHEEGTAWNQMAVIYRRHFMGETAARVLAEAGLPVAWLQQDRQSRRFRPEEDTLKITTMHSSKGLEFPVVFIPGLGYMPNSEDDEEEEARVLYVAMTRAMDNLYLTAHEDSTFTKRLNAVVGQAG